MKCIVVTKNIVIFSILISLLGTSCSGTVDADNHIYKPGREFYYDVYEIHHGAKDTVFHEIKLVVNEPEFPQFLFEQTAVEWHYLDIIEGDGYMKAATGVVEDSGNVYLHPPRKFYMSFAQIPPHPDIHLPVRMGNRSEHELVIEKGWGDTLNGKTIKSFLKVTGTENLVLGNNEYNDCFIFEGNTLNYADELGVYYAKYWFHKDFGFVKFHYIKPDSSAVIMELVTEKSKM